MASEQTIDEILTDFTNFYERKQSPAQRMFYIHSLAQYDDDILCRAAMQLKRNERPNGFPVLATIDKYYQEERNAAWQRQKHNEPKRMNFDSVDRSERFEQFKRVLDGVGNHLFVHKP